MLHHEKDGFPCDLWHLSPFYCALAHGHVIGPHGLRPVSDGHCLCLVSRESTLKDGEAIVRDQLVSLFERITGRRVPRRVIGFAPVGLSGTVVHDGLFLILRTWGWSFLHSRSVAIAAEASSSYRVNNRLTFR